MNDDYRKKKRVDMTSHEAGADVADKRRDNQLVQRCTESYGEFLNAADLDYGSVSLGRETAKERYWLKMAADHGDEKSIQELQEK